MGIKKLKRYEDLPLEVGKTYQTKISPDLYFIIMMDPYKRSQDGTITGVSHTVWGEYTDKKFLGNVPIGIDQLISDRVFVGEIEVCDGCSKRINDDVVEFDTKERRYKRIHVDAKSEASSLVQVILKHGFPNGKDENYMPKFRMKNPDIDYVMNLELTKVIRVIEVND